MRSKTATRADQNDKKLAPHGAQIQGKRAEQEDSWAVEQLDDGSVLALVADGLGGHPHGERASAEAVTEFCRVFLDEHTTAHAGPKRWIQKAVVDADRHLHALQRHDPELHGMATTLVAVYIHGGKLWSASVGDSYLLLLRGGRLTRLNELHEFDGGITSTLGFHLTQVELPDARPVEAGDRFLLASDGIATLPDDDVRDIVAEAITPEEAVTKLLERVEAAANPSQDNATAIAIFT